MSKDVVGAEGMPCNELVTVDMLTAAADETRFKAFADALQ